MKPLNMSLPQLDWRQPWCWPRTIQYALFVSAGVVGMLALSPWWLHSWQALDDANEAQAQLLTEQEARHALQVQSQPDTSFADAAALAELARLQGLQFSQVSLETPQQSPTLHGLHMQQLPVRLTVQGSWDGWLDWLAQWPTAAPGVTVSSLELKADPHGGISAQVLAMAPQSTALDAAFELSTVNSESAASVDPFSTTGWSNAQRAHAEQHPSYARWIAPELQRIRTHLEALPRERLRYVGQISQAGVQQALLRSSEGSGVAAHAPIYRVSVGDYVGQDFGRVQTIAPDQLTLRELVRDAHGVWQPRDVTLPLEEGTK